MKFKIKIKPKLTYYFSILVSSAILFYFAYKGIVAYLIHRELYGGGLGEKPGNHIEHIDDLF